MPSNIKLLQEYYPQKLKPYFRKILTYLNKNVPYSYQNNNLLSTDRIEEAYALALKHAALKKDCIQQSLYAEKLGDIYLEKSKATTLLQAAGLYNHALRLSTEDRQEIIKKKLF
jgi:ABC-type methionine transport system ATPase subunit